MKREQVNLGHKEKNICKYFLNGKCKKGKECEFKHVLQIFLPNEEDLKNVEDEINIEEFEEEEKEELDEEEQEIRDLEEKIKNIEINFDLLKEIKKN
jgi:hypothetical protein